MVAFGLGCFFWGGAVCCVRSGMCFDWWVDESWLGLERGVVGQALGTDMLLYTDGGDGDVEGHGAEKMQGLFDLGVN